MTISVCISTFKRPDYLAILLKGINEQELPEGVSLKVIVVDNDADKRSSEVVGEEIRPEFVHQLVYDVEQRRGIPFNRNKAFSLADTASEFVIFIDDDEYPEKDWIKQLLRMQQQSQADLVEGIVFPEFTEQTPKWVVKSNFLLIPHYNQLSDGEKLPHDAVMTNNLLVRYSLMKQLNGPFDEAMGLIGCDDSALGFNLDKLGCKMIFTNKAIVHEHVPLQRTTFKWLMQRGYRTANTIWLLNPDKTAFNFLKLLVTGIIRVLAGVVLLLPALIVSLFAGIHIFYKVIRIIVRGTGMLTGMFGMRYEEYKIAYTFNKPAAVQQGV